MKSWDLSNGYKITQVLEGRSNAYLINTNNGYMLVDTGRINKFDKLIDNLSEVQKSTPSLNWLVLTHTHFDHCENARMINDFFDTHLYVGSQEAKSLRKGFTALPKGSNFPTKLISFIGNWLTRFYFAYTPVVPYMEIWGTVQIDNLDIRIIPTPGHSDGSVSIIVNNEIALVGDVMYGVFYKSIMPPFADNPKTVLKSWEKLLKETQCKLFLPGHGKEISRENVLDALPKEIQKQEQKTTLTK